jgi:hypothetical protein
MQKEEAVALADKIMAERPDISIRVEHEGAYAPESYAIQIVDGLTPRTVTLSTERDWERYRDGQDIENNQWEDFDVEAEREEMVEYDQSHQQGPVRPRPQS